MSKLKSYIFAYSQRIKFLKKLYESVSYCKQKMYYYFHLVRPILQYKETHAHPIFLVFTPSHRNLGDHAIAWAETMLLSDIHVDYYEITGDQLYPLASYGYMKLLNGSRILINGGGNLGNLWPDIERMNRIIVQNNPDSMICFLPNSICYSEDSAGGEAFKTTKQIFNKHKNLYFYAREELSFNIMKHHYKNVKLVPDMVLSLNASTPYVQHRAGCIFCLRDDVERLLLEEETCRLTEMLKNIFNNDIRVSTTLADQPVSKTQRVEAVQKKLEEFQMAELVVTDRLHGMIFAAITGTKCVVLNSRSRKLKGCYAWIQSLGYIRFSDTVDDVIAQYEAMPRYPHTYDNQDVLDRMELLKQDLIKMLNE